MERHPGLTLSFTDCVGAVTAAEGRAAAVFGLDNDFRALGFSLEPGAPTTPTRQEEQ
jgi:hypothetical protein